MSAHLATLERHARICEMLRAGASHAHIAEVCGVSQDSVHRVARANGLTRTKGRQGRKPTSYFCDQCKTWGPRAKCVVCEARKAVERRLLVARATGEKIAEDEEVVEYE